MCSASDYVLHVVGAKTITSYLKCGHKLCRFWRCKINFFHFDRV